MDHLSRPQIDILTEALLPTIPLSMGMFKKESDIRIYIISCLAHAQDQEVKDLVAFVSWSRNHGKSPLWIAGNLNHDISGLKKPDPGFLPRTSGYADLEADQAAADWLDGKKID